MADDEIDAGEGELRKIPTIFINCIDTFTGSNISQHLGTCTLTPPEQEAENIDHSASEDASVHGEKTYKVIGTLNDPKSPRPGFIHDIVDVENRKKLTDIYLSCLGIIYDVTEVPAQLEEARFALNVLEENLNYFSEPKIFILLSTVLSWERTKHPNLGIEGGDNAETVPFIEEDYRRRKAHPNYSQHILLEKDVIRVGRLKRKRLRTYVISSGIKYGQGEQTLNYFFKKAWLNSPFVPCIGPSKNIIPMIYIKDLALIVEKTIEKKPKPPRHILAVDGSKTTEEEIMKAISKNLSTGNVHRISFEEALLIRELNTIDLDLLMCNIIMESSLLNETLQIVPKFEGGFVPNSAVFIKEYKQIRHLQPVRIFLHGPPGTNIEKLVHELSSYYKIHPVSLNKTLSEKLKAMEYMASYDPLEKLGETLYEEEQGEEEFFEELDMTSEAEEEQKPMDEMIQEKIQEAKDFLNMIEDSKANNNGMIEDKLLIKIVFEKLMSKPCQNQGFVLYEFPETIDQAKILFAVQEEGEETDKFKFNKLIMPELVVSLNAPDSFLKERLINLTEHEIIEQFGDEEEMLSQMKKFQTLNTEEDTVINYFDELEIWLDKIDVSKVPDTKYILERIKKKIGLPKNFGPSVEEVMEEERRIAAERLERDLKEELRREEEEREAAMTRAATIQEWEEKLKTLRKEEEEMLEAESIPLRMYLMEHVMPVLTKGLVDCVKVRPVDPVDYLAEYLFKYAPLDIPLNKEKK